MHKETHPKYYIITIVMWLLPAIGWSSNPEALQAEINNNQVEINSLKAGIEQLKELVSHNAANTIYTEDTESKQDSATEINAYVDFEFIHKKGTPTTFRNHHLSLFFKKQINEKWKFFSEIEFEDVPKFEGSTAQGKIFVEAVSFDYEWRPELIIRGGRFFTPAGIWSEDHYPPFVPTQERPAHIRKIFPQLVDGAMAHGSLTVGKNTFLKYNLYTGNGEATSGDAPGKQDNNTTKAVGLKGSVILPYWNFLELGATYYSDGSDKSLVGAEKMAIGVHGKARIARWTLQLEYANASIDPVAGGEYDRTGYYFQTMYDLNNWTLGGRVDFYDSDDSGDNEKDTNSLFVGYHVDANVVIKLEHHDISEDGKDDSRKSIFSVVYYID